MPDFNLRVSSLKAIERFDAALPDDMKILALGMRGGQLVWQGRPGVAIVVVPHGRRVLDDSDPENPVLDTAEWINLRVSNAKAWNDYLELGETEKHHDGREFVGSENKKNRRLERINNSRLKRWAEDSTKRNKRKSYRTNKDIPAYRWKSGSHWIEILIDQPEKQRHVIL